MFQELRTVGLLRPHVLVGSADRTTGCLLALRSGATNTDATSCRNSPHRTYAFQRIRRSRVCLPFPRLAHGQLWRSASRLPPCPCAADTCCPSPCERLSRSLSTTAAPSPCTEAARRAIPHSLSTRRVERDVGGPFVPLRGVIPHRPLRGRFGRTASSRPIAEALPVDVVAEDGCVHPWRLDFVQCSSRPIARVLQDETINVF